MNYLELWKLANLGIDIDIKNKTLTLRLGFITIKDISFAAAKELSSDPQLVAQLLSKHFVSREVMWQDWSAEKVDRCVHSLKDLKERNEAQAEKVGESKKDRDKIFAQILLAWANECDEAIKEFERAVENEEVGKSVEIDRDFIMYAEDKIPKILGEFRRDTYPMVEQLIELLPTDNIVRQQAEIKLRAGKDMLSSRQKVL